MLKLFCSVLFVFSFIFLSPLVGKAMAQEEDDLETRISILEDLLEEEEGKSTNLMEIGGYVDTEYIITDKKGSDDRFRIHHLSLIFKKQLNDRWSFFSEVEFEDAPYLEGPEDAGGALKKDQGKILVEAVYLDVSARPDLSLRAGRFFTPAGIWNVDHYPPFVPTQERPQHIRKIFPQFVDGAQAFGSKVLNEYKADYHIYVGNGFGEPGNSDSNQDKAVGGRFVLSHLSFADLAVGLSGFMGKDNDDTMRNSYGFDFKFQVKGLKVQGEYAFAKLDPVASAEFDRTGWYAQFIYSTRKFSYIYRYDLYEADSTTPSETSINTVAINYHFTPKIVGKVEGHWFYPEASEDFYKTIFSVAAYIF